MKLVTPVRMGIRAADVRKFKPDGMVQMKAGNTQLYLYGDIGEVFGGVGANDVQAALKGAKGNLEVFISSDGGDAFEGLAIHNIIARYPGKKTMTVDGLAASAASLILMAGDDRVMSAGSQVMVHGAWMGVIGNAPRLRDVADKLEGISKSMADVYTQRTKQSPEVVNEWMSSDETWFNAEQAIAAGLADRMENGMDEEHKKPMPMQNKIETKPSSLSSIERARLISRARKA